MEEPKKIDTLEDVARELGVSKTTVSRAISGKGRIGKETRDRIMAFIEAHDYRPNAVAKGLAQKKTYNLGLLLPVDYGDVDFSFFKDCMAGVYRTASLYHYDLIFSFVDGDELKQLRRLVQNRKMDGAIISRAMERSRVQEYLTENKMPFVVIGTSRESQVETVDNKNREAGEELTQIMLLKCGGPEPLMGGDESYVVTQNRLEGYLEAHRKLGRQPEKDFIFMNVASYSAAMEAVEKILEGGVRALICMDDVISDLALGCLREKEAAIPGTVRLASMYDSHQMECSSPSITSIRFDSVRLGSNACLRLLHMLGEQVEQETPAGYEVILRESTK